MCKVIVLLFEPFLNLIRLGFWSFGTLPNSENIKAMTAKLNGQIARRKILSFEVRNMRTCRHMT